MISGPPGAGKPTIARLLADRVSPSALVEGDEFFRFLRNGLIAPWRVDARAQNVVITGIQASTAARYRDGGYETVYDGVLGPWFVDTFTQHAGGAFDYAIMLPPVETCLHRIRNRVGHEFDDETAARSLHDQFVEACAIHSIPARHVVDSSLGTPTAVADEVASRRDGGNLRLS